MGSNAGTVNAKVPLFTRLAIADGKKYATLTKADKLKSLKSNCFKRFLNVLLMAYLDFARYHIIDKRFAKLFEGGYLGLNVWNDFGDGVEFGIQEFYDFILGWKRIWDVHQKVVDLLHFQIDAGETFALHN